MSETPNIINHADKPLEDDKIQTKRVDINVLKARAKAVQDKENLKNSVLIIFSNCSWSYRYLFFYLNYL